MKLCVCLRVCVCVSDTLWVCVRHTGTDTQSVCLCVWHTLRVCHAECVPVCLTHTQSVCHAECVPQSVCHCIVKLYVSHRVCALRCVPVCLTRTQSVCHCIVKLCVCLGVCASECCSVLQCVMVYLWERHATTACTAVCCSVLQGVTVCCSVCLRVCACVSDTHSEYVPQWIMVGHALCTTSAPYTTIPSNCNTLQHAATHCNTLQQTLWAIRQSPAIVNKPTFPQKSPTYLQKSHIWQCLAIALHCNTLQHAATRCNTLQHAATHCNTLQEHQAIAKKRLRQSVLQVVSYVLRVCHCVC